MSIVYRVFVALALLSGIAFRPATASADPIPPGSEASNLQLVGFSGLGGHSAAFKLAITHAKNGHRYLFTGQSFEPGWSIVDVTDPRNPRYVRFTPGPAGFVTSQVTLHGNLLITGVDHLRSSTSNAPVENSVLRHAIEAGRWWQPGQKDGETPLGGKKPSNLHGPANVSPDGKMVSVAYYPDIVNLDISDIAHPKLIGSLTMTPTFADNGAQSEHTVLPFWDRKLLYVSSEAAASGCDTEPLNYAGFVDNRDPAKPRLIAIFPPPRPPAGKPYKNFCDKGGRFGPHNVNQEIHNPDVMPNGNTLYIAYFNGQLDRGRGGRYVRLHLHRRRQMGRLDPARPQPRQVAVHAGV